MQHALVLQVLTRLPNFEPSEDLSGVRTETTDIGHQCVQRIVHAKIIEAEAEAKANKTIAESITPELIQMKEAEARLKHGWVTVQGADTVVTAK